MIKQLLYKWFGIEELCRTCEVLQAELDRVYREKELLLSRILEPKVEPKVEESNEDLQPVRTNQRRFIPAVVRQQVMDAEDKRSLELMQKFKKDRIEALEAEVLEKKEKDKEEVNG